MEIVGRGGFGPNSTEVLRERGGGSKREGIGEIIEETRDTSIQNVVWNKKLWGENTAIVTNIHANNCAKILFFQSSNPPPMLSQNR